MKLLKRANPLFEEAIKSNSIYSPTKEVEKKSFKITSDDFIIPFLFYDEKKDVVYRVEEVPMCKGCFISNQKEDEMPDSNIFLN